MTRLGRPVFLLNLNAREGRARARLERALGSLARAIAALGVGTERLVDLNVTTHPEAPVATVSISVGSTCIRPP